jgi:hypothetical protein
MRRPFALAVLTVCALVVAGCSGQDAEEAQQLLAQADSAFAGVRSATFTLSFATSGAPQEFSMKMTGGGYVKGKRAGDVYAIITAENVGFRDLVLVQRDGRLTASIDGQRQPTLPAPATAGNPIKVLDIGRYVKDVSVEHGKLIDGEPMTKLAGVIDTADLVRESLSAIGEVTTLGGSDFDLADALGDTRVVLYIADATHLPMRGLVDMPVKAGEEEFELHLDFAYTSINKRVAFPGLS